MRRVEYLLQLWVILNSWGMMMGEIVPKGDENNITAAEKKYYDWTIQLENYFKSGVKSLTKSMLPHMMSLQEDPEISSTCLKSLMKYVINLGKAKMWAVEMLDASSKPPSGIMIGTFADFGSFDECLNVKVFQKGGKLDFQGSSCAIWMRPPLPPLRETITLAEMRLADGEDTLGAQFRTAYRALHHKHFKFQLCVPSTCSVEDIRRIAERIANETDFSIEVPKCYVKEETVFRPVHIAVITSLCILLCLGIAGSIFESRKKALGQKISSVPERALAAFSLSSNFKRFVSASGGSTELKCLHGIRAFGICYVILGHTYVYVDFDTIKDPINVQTWFATWSFELIHNGWLGVEAFFLISGLLVTYSGMKAMVKTKGKLNLPLLILRRYLRLTPSVVLLMGLVFFLPLISSGPFWFEHVDPQVESCERYWWTTLLYFSNWWGIDKGCIQTTWYLAADFQLHILSLLLLIMLYRFTKPALGILVAAVLLSCALIGAQTWFWDLGATIFLSAGDDNLVFESLNKIHIQTFTHLGPHCIGMIVGYYIFKYREKKLSKPTVILGWCASIVISVSSILGNHRFSAHEETSQILTIMYAALHRCGFSCGIAWALLACITGYGGPVNSLLSSNIMAPIGRLTYMIYLVHPLVIWCKIGSFRERHYASHYDTVYLFLTNVIISIALAVPFYLLLESPLSNLERLLTNRSNDDSGNDQRTSNRDTNMKISTEKNGITLTKVNHHLPEFQPSHLTTFEKTHN